MRPDQSVIATVRPALDSGPGSVTASFGGLSSLRGKGVRRHVAELERLTPETTLCSIVDETRAAVATRLHLARLEVELNVWQTSAGHTPTR